MTSKMTWLFLRRLCLGLFLLGVMPSAMFAAPWFALGPYGGDARSFAADPSDSKHLYLGTASGWLYESRDGGASWVRVSQIGKRDDLVLDHILVDPKDPKRLIVGAWKLDREDGGVYVSQDGGKNWYEQAQMRGQSVRSMARSASQPNIVLAGTLRGIYRSTDNGTHWALISPAGSTEIHEIQSLAIDPADPKIIYAGTWHLPWKTEDGGENWTNIKQGIIEDSDVFSIIIDPQTPTTVYLSACSGIYKSLDAAAQFLKIPRVSTYIPSSARRTRKLLQDPTNLDTVYAGTTEGLYKTLDGGKTFARMTDPNVVINDVYVDPNNPNHVLLATNRGGVLSSEDGGTTFGFSNNGFSARQVSSFASNARNGSVLYVGVVNDKETGGVFQSVDGGLKWQQQSNGLGGRDVFSLASTSSGTLLAGTAHGIYRFEADAWLDSSEWVPGTPEPPAADATNPATDGTTEHPARKPVAEMAKGKARPKAAAKRKPVAAPHKPTHAAVHRVGQSTDRRAPAKKAAPKKPAPRVTKREVPDALPPPPSRVDTVVYSLANDGDTIYAGTEQGLMRSSSDGHTWERVKSLDKTDIHFIAAQQQLLMAAGLKQIDISMDSGATWTTVTTPDGLTQIAAIAVDEKKNLWVGGGEGVYYSSDRGVTWKTLRDLFLHQVDGIYFDAPEHRVLVTSSRSTFAFAVYMPDFQVKYWDSGWTLRFVRPVGDHLIGATLWDGMVLQPQMVDSPLSSLK